MVRSIVLIAALTVTFPAIAQKPCPTIQAQPNGSTVTVRGSAPANTPFACYTLMGVPGRTATVKIRQPNPSVAFNIAGVVDNHDSYSFKMQAKPYRIDVYDMGSAGSSPFTLQVSIR